MYIYGPPPSIKPTVHLNVHAAQTRAESKPLRGSVHSVGDHGDHGSRMQLGHGVGLIATPAVSANDRLACRGIDLWTVPCDEAGLHLGGHTLCWLWLWCERHQCRCGSRSGGRSRGHDGSCRYDRGRSSRAPVWIPFKATRSAADTSKWPHPELGRIEVAPDEHGFGRSWLVACV